MGGTGGCGPPSVDAGNLTQVSCKSNEFLELQSNLSTSKISFLWVVTQHETIQLSKAILFLLVVLGMRYDLTNAN